MKGYRPNNPGNSLDNRIAAWVNDHHRKHPGVDEALAERIHDHAIDNALKGFVRLTKTTSRKLIGIMGSHGTSRKDENYKSVAELAWKLCKEGFCIVTGGGPGIMEAGNLGAYMSGEGLNALQDALTMLAAAPTYPGNEAVYISAATSVRLKYSDSGNSLAIPTWTYATEPTGQFSSQIGKYFSNSIREDGLLAIASWGVIFAPGSAGTLQEIFQDAAHNSYWSFGTRAPMVFLDKSVFLKDPSIFKVLQARATQDGYGDMVDVFSTPDEIVKFIKTHPKRSQTGTTFGSTFGLSDIVIP
jgi:predicted Rossmann-fold nucleotide-binding protein